MNSFATKITILCFAASYAVTFALELWRLKSPGPVARVVALGFAAAGLFAHVSYLIINRQSLPLGSPTGSLLLIALILAVFYLFEAVHHFRIAWAIFVLPVVLALIGLAVITHDDNEVRGVAASWKYFWGVTHGTLLILAAVGVSVGFIASVMYFVQLRRLQAKIAPGQGLTLFNLERLEQMNRRAILWSFPFLTAGLLAGFALQVYDGLLLQDWFNPRIASVIGLWVVFAILLYLRYRVHVRGRALALWTMVAFAILLVALISPPHVFEPGAQP